MENKEPAYDKKTATILEAVRNQMIEINMILDAVDMPIKLIPHFEKEKMEKLKPYEYLFFR